VGFELEILRMLRVTEGGMSAVSLDWCDWQRSRKTVIRLLVDAYFHFPNPVVCSYPLNACSA